MNVTELVRRIETRQATVGIIGLGYVGLPLAREFAGGGAERPRLEVLGEDAERPPEGDLGAAEARERPVEEGELVVVPHQASPRTRAIPFIPDSSRP